MLFPHNTMAQTHFLQCLQIMWYHNFHCCSSYPEWVQKGLKVKHQANKLHCLVSVVLNQLQTMKIEQPGNAAQSELLQRPLGASRRSGTCNYGLNPLASFQSVLYSSAHASAQQEMALLVMKTRFGHALDAAILGPSEYCLDMRRTLSVLG